MAWGMLGGAEKLAVADRAQGTIRLIDLDDARRPEIVIPLAGLRSLDWWWNDGPRDQVRSEDGVIRPEEIQGDIIAATDSGVYRVYKQGDDFAVQQIASDTNVKSVFGDNKGHVYYTTEDGSLKVIVHNRSGDYDVPEVLAPCGSDMPSVNTVVPFFGSLMVAKQKDDATQLDVVERKNAVFGWLAVCSRCGIFR